MKENILSKQDIALVQNALFLTNELEPIIAIATEAGIDTTEYIQGNEYYRTVLSKILEHFTPTAPTPRK